MSSNSSSKNLQMVQFNLLRICLLSFLMYPPHWHDCIHHLSKLGTCLQQQFIVHYVFCTFSVSYFFLLFTSRHSVHLRNTLGGSLRCHTKGPMLNKWIQHSISLFFFSTSASVWNSAVCCAISYTAKQRPHTGTLLPLSSEWEPMDLFDIWPLILQPKYLQRDM